MGPTDLLHPSATPHFKIFLSYTTKTNDECVISGYRLEVDENLALLGYYATNSGNSLQTFRDSLSVKSPIRCPETSVSSYHYSLCNNPNKRSSLLEIDEFKLMKHSGLRSRYNNFATDCTGCV
jgi:hypothetical protein